MAAGTRSVFFHIDLDAFFASAEELDDPSLAGKPVVVGAAPGHRGVVSTCSYAARRYGIHSAMPISEAYRLCPEAVFLPVRMARYAELSSRVMAVFQDYTPDVVRVSIDEASMDMSGTERLWGSPSAAAASIRDRVQDEIGLSISIGVAANRYVAKVASGTMKPAGLVVVPEGEEAAFMAALRLKDLWGVGAKTRARLTELGIDSMERLLALSPECVSSIFGNAGGDFIYRAARGIDPGIYGGESKSRSISSETTFETDVVDREYVEGVLLGMAEELVSRLYAEGACSRCAVLKLRYDDFETLSARETRPAPFAGSSGVYEAARGLLERKWNGRPLRLVGLGLAGLDEGGSGQAELFEERGDREARVERAGIAAARKGLGKLTRARLVPRPPSD
ncbi:MAG: DNA polymerase IV [Spirochaetae bacterium HGW-Spirochaetae-3]|jgi:DNA polymerase-4|nr:MAG: DNA polymerase IV [Spirochaetae bacterium HGW-Spirochaetae-3]